jgi:thiol-disulfide isomerase/thioredoxin
MTGRRRPSAMRVLFLVVVLGLVFASPAYADTLKVGDRLAELDGAVDGNGKAFRLKPIAGWRVISFGASWCKPCAKELPAWDKIAPQWKGKVTFIAVNLDSEIDAGKAFHKKLKLKNMLLSHLNPDSAIAAKYGSDKMPTTIVADPQGVIRYIHGGFEKGDAAGEVKKMNETLQKLVK